MEQYTLVLMQRGEKWNPGAPEFMHVIKQHSAFLKEMTEQGKMAIAGPFPLSEPGELRGIEIFRVGAEQAAKLVQEDPTVKAGQLKPEIHPWITGKGASRCNNRLGGPGRNHSAALFPAARRLNCYFSKSTVFTGRS